MGAIFRLAAQVTRPIGLAALVVAVLFGLFLTLLKLPVFRKLAQGDTYRLLRLFLWLVFSFAVLTLIFWFAGETFHLRTATGESDFAPNDEAAIRNARVKLNFRNTSLHDVLMSLAQQAGATLAMDKSLDGRLSMGIDGKLSEVMDQICETEHCTWEVHSGHPPILFVNSRVNSPR